MAGRDSKQYDQFKAPFVVPISGVSVAGTAASITALTAAQWKMPFNCKLRGGTRVSTTGGTAAGPSVLIQSSLAGTGTWTSLGTAAFGTDASGVGSDFTVADTAVLDGDHVRLAIAAGTAAATHTVNFVLEFVEMNT